MKKIRLTKNFEFEMAHALYNYDGLCRNIHGHSYKLSITIIGEPNPDPDSPKFGMVMDFGLLKQIINNNIINKFDHSLVVYKDDNYECLLSNEMFKRIHIFDFQPTAENLILYFVNILKELLPENIKLFSIKLHETTNSFAEWYASDQA